MTQGGLNMRLGHSHDLIQIDTIWKSLHLRIINQMARRGRRSICLHELLNIINSSWVFFFSKKIDVRWTISADQDLKSNGKRFRKITDWYNRGFQTIMKKTRSFKFDLDLRIIHQDDIHLIHLQHIRPVQIMTVLLDFDTLYFQSSGGSIEK